MFPAHSYNLLLFPLWYFGTIVPKCNGGTSQQWTPRGLLNCPLSEVFSIQREVKIVHCIRMLRGVLYSECQSVLYSECPLFRVSFMQSVRYAECPLCRVSFHYAVSYKIIQSVLYSECPLCVVSVSFIQSVLYV